MVKREIIKAEVERVPEDRLEEAYEVVRFYSRRPTQTNSGNLLSKLKSISIEGPEDFSENIDL